MGTRNHTYTAGPSPDKVDDEGNGRWEVRADSPDAALRAIMASVTFPGELAGRFFDVFVEGVSLPGRSDLEVIQLWSDDPEVIKRTADFGDRWVAENPQSWHLFGFPHRKGDNDWTCRFGLVCEIAVEDIGKYLIPKRAMPDSLLLPAPGDRTALSPIGEMAAAGLTLEHRQRLYLSAQDARLRQVRSQMEIEASADELNAKVGQMNRQLAILETYMHGLTAAEILHRGDRASAETPYHVFQSRLYLDQEIGLMVNLIDLDFRDVPALDEWLVETGHWRKMLPHPKTILVTRIRAQEKHYTGCAAIQGAIWNHWNMQNLVWVRDGEFLFRFATDLSFDNAIFKGSGEVERVERHLRARVFSARFARQEEGKKDRPGLQKDAAHLDKPYIRVEQRTGHASLEEWLESPDFKPEMAREIYEAARAYVEGCSVRRLPFLVLLQGMVDSTTVLNIPPGTNLLDPLAIGRYFRLVYDKEGALADSTARKRFEELSRPDAQKRGSWVLGRLGRDSTVTARFYQVVSVGADGVTVRYTPSGKRWPYVKLKHTRTRKLTRFIPGNLPDDLVRLLLDDRDWKIKHPSLVPVLARWDRVKSYLAGTPANEGELPLGEGLNVFDQEGNA